MTIYSNINAIGAERHCCIKYLARSIDGAFGHPVFVLAIHLCVAVLAAILSRGLPVLMRTLPRFHPCVFFGCRVDGVRQVDLV